MSLVVIPLTLLSWAVASPMGHNQTLLSRADVKYNHDCPRDFCGKKECGHDYTGKYTHPMGEHVKKGVSENVKRPFRHGHTYKCWDEVWLTDPDAQLWM
ncbi:MAG: hypothetical protein Q9169_006144 [Polycauliona sp. 2 TL-2023]